MADDDGLAATTPVVAPYRNLRVVQLTGGIEVAFCAKVLADAGADVAFVEPAAGHHLRFARRAWWPDRDRAPLFSYLHAGKRSLVIEDDDLDGVLARSDVVVTDALPRPWDALHADHPHLTAVVISPFGTEGPRCSEASSDLTLQAAAGGMAPRGAVDGAPLMVGGEPTFWFAGAVAAVSLLGVVPRLTISGAGELLDVSMLEAAHLEHCMHPVTFTSMAGRPFQAERGVPVPGIEPTADGWVGFFVITGQQWLDFCALIERPDWTEDEVLFIAAQRRRQADRLLPPIRSWTSSRTTDEIVEVASLLRIPVAPIGTGESLATIDQFVAEDWFVEHPDGFVQPRRPYRFGREPIPTPGPTDEVGGSTIDHWSVRPPPRPESPAGELPLAGIRVADFTGFWAGPLAAGILAGLGADVVHVEGPRRPDGIRMNSLEPMTAPGWWEWSPLFCGANTNKRGLAVDLSVDAGREVALDLISSADIMIENFSPRVVDQLGLGPDAVLAAKPDAVVVRMPAFGLAGPWRDRVGFAQTIEQAVGLAFLTGYENEAPVIPNGMCDPLAGVFGAIAALVGLAERDRTGVGQVVESPMVGGGLNVAAQALIDYSASGLLHRAMGNRSPHHHQDVYRCRGEDAWVAIALPTPDAVEALTGVAGLDGPEDLGEWCAQRSAAAIVEALSPRGVPVAPVRWPHETIEDAQLAARGFFEWLVHPVCGSHPYMGWPTRFDSGPHRWNRRPAPTLGQHNAELLTELGVSQHRIASLRRGGVIAEGVLDDQRAW